MKWDLTPVYDNSNVNGRFVTEQRGTGVILYIGKASTAFYKLPSRLYVGHMF